MATATTIATQTERQVIRCVKCGLVQFQGTSAKCLRCRENVRPPSQAQTATPIRRRERIDLENLSQRITEMRVTSGMSRKAFYEAVGTASSWLSRVEHGARPSLGMLERMAEVLNIPIRSFFERDVLNDIAADWLTREVIMIMRDAPQTRWHSIIKVLEKVDRVKQLIMRRSE